MEFSYLLPSFFFSAFILLLLGSVISGMRVDLESPVDYVFAAVSIDEGVAPNFPDAHVVIMFRYSPCTQASDLDDVCAGTTRSVTSLASFNTTGKTVIDLSGLKVITPKPHDDTAHAVTSSIRLKIVKLSDHGFSREFNLALRPMPFNSRKNDPPYVFTWTHCIAFMVALFVLGYITYMVRAFQNMRIRYNESLGRH